jgi:hypothetical protein
MKARFVNADHSRIFCEPVEPAADIKVKTANVVGNPPHAFNLFSLDPLQRSSEPRAALAWAFSSLCSLRICSPLRKRVDQDDVFRLTERE